MSLPLFTPAKLVIFPASRSVRLLACWAARPPASACLLPLAARLLLLPWLPQSCSPSTGVASLPQSCQRLPRPEVSGPSCRIARPAFARCLPSLEAGLLLLLLVSGSLDGRPAPGLSAFFPASPALPAFFCCLSAWLPFPVDLSACSSTFVVFARPSAFQSEAHTRHKTWEALAVSRAAWASPLPLAASLLLVSLRQAPLGASRMSFQSRVSADLSLLAGRRAPSSSCPGLAGCFFLCHSVTPPSCFTGPAGSCSLSR